MDAIDRKGLLAVDSRADFTRNAIVLVKPAVSTIQIKSLQDLARGEVKRIVIGNPKTVPAGRYAEEVLKHANIWSVIQDKLVFAENVRQALDYVARNEVDAGLVYATDAKTRPGEVTAVMTAPENSHKPVVYPIAAIKGTKAEVPSRKFVQFVLSVQGQEILHKYGFQPLLSVK
jgi:molybdate transport system substrate-binding protein